ncbi:MAG: hypothetical protein A4E53_01725 [Pelotomaculum sp. PtaB.Bin104]|nr:MAG: hypothetical protein A4E53_01725 [Pelotomaculum sp. PtaB.Bin104]
MFKEGVKCEPPGDIKVRLEKISDNIHRLICQASAMRDDGKDISKILDRIEAEFDKI